MRVSTRGVGTGEMVAPPEDYRSHSRGMNGVMPRAAWEEAAFSPRDP